MFYLCIAYFRVRERSTGARERLPFLHHAGVYDNSTPIKVEAGGGRQADG